MELITHPRRVVLYIAASLDGYIAKPNDDLSFLAMVEHEGEDYGYSDFMKTVDTVIMGRKTYDWVMTRVPKFPHADLCTYIITRTARVAEGNIKFYSGSLKESVVRLKAEKGKNFSIDGGAEIVHELLKEQLIEEFSISIIPVILGEGIRLYRDGSPEHKLNLIDSKHFNSGLTQLHYQLVEKEK